MVTCSIYQCRNCKTVFKAKWYRWTNDDGPWIPEPYYYEEYIAGQQKCPECGSGSVVLDFIGRLHITRKERKLLTLTLDKSPLLNPMATKMKEKQKVIK